MSAQETGTTLLATVIVLGYIIYLPFSGYMNKLNTVCNRQGWTLTKDEGVQSGPKHQPMWTGHVYVNGNPFEGQGRSISAAREVAAKAALDHYRAYNPGVVPSDF